MILKVAFKNEDSIKDLQELLKNYPLIELIEFNETSNKKIKTLLWSQIISICLSYN